MLLEESLFFWRASFFFKYAYLTFSTFCFSLFLTVCWSVKNIICTLKKNEIPKLSAEEYYVYIYIDEGHCLEHAYMHTYFSSVNSHYFFFFSFFDSDFLYDHWFFWGFFSWNKARRPNFHHWNTFFAAYAVSCLLSKYMGFTSSWQLICHFG